MEKIVNQVQYKKVLLETFEQFVSICKQYNLQYYGAFGTVIGAVRHLGLIPWDDDIDVYMPRKDYEYFLKLKDSLNDDFEIVDRNDESYFLNFAKFCNKHTTILESNQLPCVYGVFVDVFPLDEYNDELSSEIAHKEMEYERAFQIWFKSVREHSLKEMMSTFTRGNVGEAIKILSNFCYYRFLKNKYLKRMKEIESFFMDIRGDYYCRYSVYAKECVIYPKEWFTYGVELPFEHLEITVPLKYKDYLKKRYGNYLELPPENQRCSGHSFYYVNLEKRMTIDEIRHEIRKNRS